MHILFINNSDNVDYQCDCLFYGLNELEDVTLYTLTDYWFMYTGNEVDKLTQLYGMGFSVTNRIVKKKKCIHTLDIAKENIKNNFYDLIIYGSICRCNLLLTEVLVHYKRNKIIFVDGEDEDFGLRWIKRIKGNLPFPKFFVNEKKLALYYASKGIYFKRELQDQYRTFFYPISFAIPSCNLVNSVPEKTKEMAYIIPGQKETYIYHQEEDYYKGYQNAKFALTVKKAGWDCMRHYEILANGCIPYFPNIERCPMFTMLYFPKELIKETNFLYEHKLFSDSSYQYYASMLLEYTRHFLTTKKLAQYVLSFLT